MSTMRCPECRSKRFDPRGCQRCGFTLHTRFDQARAMLANPTWQVLAGDFTPSTLEFAARANRRARAMSDNTARVIIICCALMIMVFGCWSAGAHRPVIILPALWAWGVTLVVALRVKRNQRGL